MTKEEVEQVVTHTGDCYRIKTRREPDAFNMYVSKIGEYGLEQDAGGDLPYRFVSYESIEWVRTY